MILLNRLILLLFFGMLVPVRAFAEPVARVVMSIGAPSVSYGAASSGGVQSSVLLRDSEVKTGATITTGPSDQVNLRFADDSLIIVRPSSRFVIEQYDFNPEDPAATVVRYRLEQGVSRLVSGKGVEASKDKFRLNTPIAAIGVRGTDFVARYEPALQESTVRVNSGEVVMSSFGEGCAATGLGPCNTDFSKALSGEESGLMLRLRQGALSPEKIQADDLVSGQPVQLASLVSQTTSDGNEPTGAGSEEPVGQSGSTEKPAQADSSIRPGNALGSDKSNGQVHTDVESEALDNLVFRETKFGKFVVPRGEQSIFWGRLGTARANDSLTRPVLAISEIPGKSLEPIASLTTDYILYREVPDQIRFSPDFFKPMTFGLSDGFAFLFSKPGQEISFHDAFLKVDIGRGQFMTGLALQSGGQTIYSLDVKGFTSTDGVLYEFQNDTDLRGAVAIDGGSAGYAFTGESTQGTVQGLTVWERLR